MRRLRYRVRAVAMRSARVGALVVLSTLVLGSPPASALPRVTPANCDLSKISNAALLACNLEGGQIACVKSGEAFCCKKNDIGGQDCEAIRVGGRPEDVEVTLGAILQSTQTTARLLQQLTVKVDALVSSQGEPSICTSVDFVPENITCPASPGGNLEWTAYNEGSSETDAQGTVASTKFDTLNGPVVVHTNIPPLAAGGSAIVKVPIPAGCNGCTGTVAVNTTNSATPIELIVSNNIASFKCLFIQ